MTLTCGLGWVPKMPSGFGASNPIGQGMRHGRTHLLVGHPTTLRLRPQPSCSLAPGGRRRGRKGESSLTFRLWVRGVGINLLNLQGVVHLLKIVCYFLLLVLKRMYDWKYVLVFLLFSGGRKSKRKLNGFLQCGRFPDNPRKSGMTIKKNFFGNQQKTFSHQQKTCLAIKKQLPTISLCCLYILFFWLAFDFLVP